MAGEGRLQRQLGRLGVADLTDHHDVGVLAQHGSQRAVEGVAGPLVDLRLDDFPQLVLHRVLDGDQLAVLGGQVGQQRVQGGGLPRPGRARDQHQALRPFDSGEDRSALMLVEARVLQGVAPLIAAQDAHDDRLAEHRRDGRQPQVDGVLGPVRRSLEVRPAVLGLAPFGDVEAGD